MKTNFCSGTIKKEKDSIPYPLLHARNEADYFQVYFPNEIPLNDDKIVLEIMF